VDAALVYPAKSQQQIGQRRLARSGKADQPNLFAGWTVSDRSSMIGLPRL